MTGLDPVIHAAIGFAHEWMGVTNGFLRRAHEHREGVVPGFTKRHQVKRLVYCEQHPTVPQAIQCEKSIKHWPRCWKIDLVTTMNPDWVDLWDDLAR